MVRPGNRILSIGPTTDQAHHPVPETPLLYPIPKGRNGARNFQTQNLGFSRWRRVVALALDHVRPVNAGGGHSYQYLSWPGGRLRNGCHPHDFRSAKAIIDNCFHQVRFRLSYYCELSPLLPGQNQLKLLTPCSTVSDWIQYLSAVLPHGPSPSIPDCWYTLYTETKALSPALSPKLAYSECIPTLAGEIYFLRRKK